MLVFMFTFGALENFVAIYAAENGLPSGSILLPCHVGHAAARPRDAWEVG